MSSFKYNISKSKNHFKNVDEELGKYCSSCEKMFGLLRNLKGCWNGIDCDEFQKNVEIDYRDYVSLLESLKSYHKLLKNLVNKLSNSFGKITNLKDETILYDSEYLKKSVTDLNKISTYGDHCIHEFLDDGWPENYDFDRLDAVLNAARDLKNDCDSYVKEINDLINEIEPEIDSINSETSKIEFRTVNSSIIDVQSASKIVFSPRSMLSSSKKKISECSN